MGELLQKNFVKNMNELRAKHNAQFYINISILHKQGWSLQEIANSFEVSKSAVANWERKGIELGQKTFTVYPPTLPAKAAKPAKEARQPKPPMPELTLDEQATILSLAQQASKVSRNTPIDAPSRIAASKLEERLYFFHTEIGVSLSKLAAAAGVTRRAIAQRLEKERAKRGE